MPQPGQRLTIYIGESDSWRGRSLYMSILQLLRKHEIAGATVTRGVAGFGAHSRIHTGSIEVLSGDLPLVITIIDSPENITRALTLVKPMLREGLMTLEDVQIVSYTHRHLNLLPADLPVSEIMTRNPATVTPDTPAADIIKRLPGKTFTALPVIDDSRRVIGIITTEDLLQKAGMPVRLSIGEKLDSDALRDFWNHIRQDKTARDIMTAPVHTAHENDSLGHTVQFMLEHGLKRLPVLDKKDKLTGILSRLDILRATAPDVKQSEIQHPAEESRQGKTLAEIMSPHMPAVKVYDDLVDILQQILTAGEKRVIVLDENGKAIGIITEADLVARVSPVVRRGVFRALADRVLGRNIQRGRATARELMSADVLSAPGETPLAEAITLMLRDGRKRIVVLDLNGQPIGIVSRQMLLAATITP